MNFTITGGLTMIYQLRFRLFSVERCLLLLVFVNSFQGEVELLACRSLVCCRAVNGLSKLNPLCFF